VFSQPFRKEELLMLRALFLAVTILGLPLGYASADAPPAPIGNAALKYWQAFATLPQLTEAEGQKLSAECLTMPLDAQAREIVSKAEYALQMMHYGAALPRCEWGIGYEEGVYTRLPQANAARVLSSLACLRARLRFEDGQSAEAVDDITAAWTLGRHLSLEGGFIIVLVGYQIEHRMIETLAPNLPRLNPGMLKDLRMRLAALPPFRSQADMLRTDEERSLDWFIRKVKEAKDKEALLARLSWIDAAEGPGRDSGGKARAFLDECGGTAEGIIKFAEETRPSFELLAKKMDLPLDQFDKEFEREAMKQAGNPVYKVFFPAIPKCRRAQARADVRRALLLAAIDVQLKDRTALKNHPDPVVGGPFEYAAFPGGFELRSKFKQDDKPLTLTVGRRGR
jgi:hypothetical protein